MNEESRAFGVSMRGWIAVFVVFTVCMMSLIQAEVREPLYTLCTTIVGFYYGSKYANAKQSEPSKEDKNGA